MTRRTGTEQSMMIRLIICLTLSLTFADALNAQDAQDSSSGARRFESTSPRVEKPFNPGLMRIDLTISTPEASSWLGEIRLSRGSFGDLTPLGMQTTSPTDFFFLDAAQTCIALSNRSPAKYTGVEVTLFAPADARLEISLKDRVSGRSLAKTVFVDRLVASAVRIPVDSASGSLEIARAPADDLPIRIEKYAGAPAPFDAPGIFKPNETFRLAVAPRSCSGKPERGELELSLSARMTDNDATPFWTDRRQISLDDLKKTEELGADPGAAPTPLLFNVTTPDREGVAEIVLELIAKAPASKSTFSLAPGSKRAEDSVIARRSFQFVVISPEKIDEYSDSPGEVDGDLRAELLETIDPTNASWKKSFSKRSFLSLPRLTQSGAFPESSDRDSAQPSGVRQFAEIRPAAVNRSTQIGEELKTQYELGSAVPPSSGLILGQAPVAEFSPFSLSLFGRGTKGEGDKKSALRTEMQKRRDFVSSWEKGGFDRCMRALDRSAWGLSGDLWESNLSSGSSRVFTPAEAAQFASPKSRFIRLEPNGFDASSDTSVRADEAVSLFLSGAHSQKISWEAYPIPIQDAGKPHLLEIEYPSGFEQKLAVSILEPDAFGALLPTGIDSGIVVESNPLSDRSAPETSRFTLLFWPKSRTPVVLLSNCSSLTPAAYGQIRIYRADDEETSASTPNRGRIFGVAATGANLCDQFSARRGYSIYGLRGSESWLTFSDAVDHALYYLSACNYDVMTMPVIADGSSLANISRLSSSPKLDGGIFLATGGDPARKDVLGYALLRFEKQRKSLIPLVRFNGTLPALEFALMKNRADSASPEQRAAKEGIEWIGPGGKRLGDVKVRQDGSAQYYNVLHPDVEREVLTVIRELASRCAPFDSFAGLALDVGAEGWLSLPDDVYYGMDDETIARFVRESGLQTRLAARTERRVQELLLAKGEERYRLRAEFIRDVCLNEWLAWRADAFARFCAKVRETAAAQRPDARLFLIASDPLGEAANLSGMTPQYVGQTRLRDVLKLKGLDPTQFASSSRQRSGITQTRFLVAPANGVPTDSAVALLRPEVTSPSASLAQTAVFDEFATPEAVSLFNAGQTYPGTVFLHQSVRRPMYGFDALSPFFPTVAESRMRALPAGVENRRRFAKALALGDSLCFLDGGEFAPLGQEDALRDWVHAFKSLPAVPFKTWTPSSSDSQSKERESEIRQTDAPGDQGKDAKVVLDDSIQPLVVRFCKTEKETWYYFLNSAPFHLGVSLSLRLRSGASCEIFAGLRREEPKQLSDSVVWNFTMTPYDLLAMRVNDPSARIETVEVVRPVEICGTDGRLKEEVEAFIDRTLAARQGVPFPLRNGDFEESFSRGQTLDGDSEAKRSGTGSQADKTGLFGLDMPQMNLFKKNARTGENANLSNETETAETVDSRSVPGWRAFGPADVDVRTDAQIFHNGKASLRISSEGSAGGALCQPFDPPATGRLCAEITFGIPQNAQELPLFVSLTGTRNGEPFTKRIEAGTTLVQRLRGSDSMKPDQNGVVWVTDRIFFDRLPLDGLRNASLRFELCGKGVVWVDDVSLMKLKLFDSEVTELMRSISAAEYRVGKNRVTDVMFMLDGFWARLLREEIPDPSVCLVARPAQTVKTAERIDDPKPAQDEKKDGALSRAWDRVKFW